ncbi:MAG: head-tail adaptor protein [Tannerellaceae bacterium]
MRAGLLNQRVRFFENRATETEYGSSSERVLVAEKWANVKYQRGDNALKNYALTQTQTLLVTIRLDKAIHERMELEFEGATYKLTKPIIDRQDASMQFIAELIPEEDATQR